MGFLKGIRDSINKMNYEQNRINEYKEQWNKKKVIQFKNERIAILLRHSGAQVQFIIAFDDLTREGYRCVAQDEGQSFSMAGFSGGIAKALFLCTRSKKFVPYIKRSALHTAKYEIN